MEANKLLTEGSRRRSPADRLRPALFCDGAHTRRCDDTKLTNYEAAHQVPNSGVQVCGVQFWVSHVRLPWQLVFCVTEKRCARRGQSKAEHSSVRCQRHICNAPCGCEHAWLARTYQAPAVPLGGQPAHGQ